MKIDIDSLTEAELIDLNNRIVARLRFFNQMRAHAQMLKFKIGDLVAFQPADRPLMVGMLTRYNKEDRHCYHRQRRALERLARPFAESRAVGEREPPGRCCDPASEKVSAIMPPNLALHPDAPKSGAPVSLVR